jgi:hypothetical protein
MRIRLRVQKLDRPQLVAHDRILRRYGANCYPQSVEDRYDHWKVPIGAYLQSRICDEKKEKERIFTFNFQNVGEILVRKSTMRILSATSLRSLGKSIFKKKAEVRKTVEQDLIKIFGKKEIGIRFHQLRFAFAGLQPIYRTIGHLLQEDYPTYDEMSRIGENYLEQVELLVGIGYAEYTEQEPRKLVATNKLKELFIQNPNQEETIDSILGLVLSEYYYDLRKGRRIAQFIPYVRASTAYYGDAIQFGELIRIKEERLRYIVRDYYRGAPLPLKLRYAYPTLLRELVDAQILDYEDDYIVGRPNIFERLIDIRNQLPVSEVSSSFG